GRGNQHVVQVLGVQYAHQAGFARTDTVAGEQRPAQRDAVVRQHYRQLSPLHDAGREHVGVGSDQVEFADAAPGREVGVTDAGPVTTRSLVESSDDDLLDLDVVEADSLKRRPAGHVGIHAGPADVLADQVDDQHV